MAFRMQTVGLLQLGITPRFATTRRVVANLGVRADRRPTSSLRPSIKRGGGLTWR